MPDRRNRYLPVANDTAVTAVLFVVILLCTVLTDAFNGPEPAPPYLIGLLGMSGALLFGTAGSDKARRDRHVSETAMRAEAKVDKLIDVAETQHPGSTGEIKSGGEASD